MLCPMFIRRTRTRTGERGEVYYSHRLVRSERTGEKVRQRTLLNLGSDFPVERRHWAVLCARIQRLLDRQAELVPLTCPEEVERHAQRLVAQLLNGAASGGGGRPDLQTVDVGSLELVRPRSVGVEHVGLWAMERLGLEALLERLGFNGTQRALAMASVIARMAQPGSERASWRWLCERSALGELLGVDFERMSMMRLYRASDALMARRAAIEAQLFDRVTDLFGLRHTVTLYDLTNTFFEGEAAAQPRAERGHSKEKRSDCPLLTLGLVLDGSGFVRRSEVFSGAVNEDRTLASMLDALGAPADALVVMDAGVATEANIAWLRENGYRYLAVKGHTTSWIGYKLHIDAADGGIPLSCILTSASLHDSQVAIPLATMTAERVTNLYDLMDSAYDVPEIGWHSYLLGHVPIIDINPRDKDYKEELAREAGAQSRIGYVHPADERYDERSNVERVNAGLKDNCGGRHVRVRGHAKVHCHLMFAILALTVDQLMRLLT